MSEGPRPTCIFLFDLRFLLHRRRFDHFDRHTTLIASIPRRRYVVCPCRRGMGGSRG